MNSQEIDAARKERHTCSASDGITIRLNHLGSGQYGNPGDVVTVTPQVAVELIGSGFAEKVS